MLVFIRRGSARVLGGDMALLSLPNTKLGASSSRLRYARYIATEIGLSRGGRGGNYSEVGKTNFVEIYPEWV